MSHTCSERSPSYDNFKGYKLTDVPEPDMELVHVGPRTPCGELLRRYWQPIAQSCQLEERRPLRVRALDENLVLFRDLSGNLDLLHALCSHRQASLEFGTITEHGIRCCYHGWRFDVDGTILEAPPDEANGRILQTVRQGAYPVREYKGLIFTYMGPLEEMPDFPLFDTFEEKGLKMEPYSYDYPCHWLQTVENVLDPYHTVFLHTRVSGIQFSEAFGEMPVVEWRPMPSDAGIYLFNVRRVDQKLWIRMQESFRPNFSQTGDIWQDAKADRVFLRVGLSKWILPIDDTHCKVIGWRYFGENLDVNGKGDRSKVGLDGIDFVGQLPDRSLAEQQAEPDDYETIVSQGGRTGYANQRMDHLAHSDGGVALIRKKLREAIDKVRNNEPLPRPKIASDGRISSYTQDAIFDFPPAPDEDRQARLNLGARVADIVVATDDLPLEERREEIRLRVNEEFGTSL